MGLLFVDMQPPHLRRPPKKRVSEYIQYLIDNSVSTLYIGVKSVCGGNIGIAQCFPYSFISY